MARTATIDMAYSFVLDMSPSSLPGFSVKIRCGLPGTRFRIISDSGAPSEGASPSTTVVSSSESPVEDMQDDSLMAGISGVHLSFGDDAQGAFLLLHFSPAYHEPAGHNSGSSSGSPSASTVSSSSMSSFHSSSMPSPTLWTRDAADRSPLDEPTLGAVDHFDLPPSDIQDLKHMSPFLNENIDLYSLMAMISGNSYPQSTSPFTTTSPGSNHSSPPSVPVSQTELSTPYTTSSPGAESDAKDTSLSHPYLCPQPGCNRRFKREYNLSLHIRTHEPRPKKRFACVFPGCNGLKFSRKHDLFRHICNLHSNTATWTCDWCSSEFPNSDALVAHVRVHYSESSEAPGHQSYSA